MFYGGLWLLGLYRPPDRRLLERTILPHYGADPDFHRVLFVGVQRYTRGYQRFFPGKRYITIDASLTARRHGARHHVFDSVENLRQYFDEQSFDLIVMNGVIGWGLDEVGSIARALKACRICLREGGHLILGINQKRIESVCFDALVGGLEPVTPPGIDLQRLTLKTPLPERSHTYLFYRKQDCPRKRCRAQRGQRD